MHASGSPGDSVHRVNMLVWRQLVRDTELIGVRDTQESRGRGKASSQNYTANTRQMSLHAARVDAMLPRRKLTLLSASLIKPQQSPVQ